jgi:hypothetical protein|tara:strand:- start:181 stop:405 length:225 start_codon:yes stop_codon:yes gene_type:complete
MKKEELIKLIKNIHTEDKTGDIIGVFYDRFGGVINTDSIRIDMDGGRIILAQQGTEYYETNKKNWETELKFIKK